MSKHSHARAHAVTSRLHAPTRFFDKGFGDLPEGMRDLRPLAATGLIGYRIPARSSTTTFDDEGEAEVERHPHALQWGGSIQYSLQHMQFAVEAVVPVNRRTGGAVGWIAQLHSFLDDLFPQSIGKALFK